jgi:pimeloyl-ACP methyl ester carboxylesterase
VELHRTGSEQQQSFEKQYAHKIPIETAHGRAYGIDIVPDILSDAIPIFLAPGWGETPTVFKNSLRTVTGNKRRALTLSHGRKLDTHIPLREYPQIELQKAETISRFLELQHIEKTDIIAHSEGAINALIFAADHPERVRDIVLVAPAGLSGEDTPARLLLRFGKMLAQSSLDIGKRGMPFFSKMALVRLAAEATKYFGKNPLLTHDELTAIATTDTTHLLENLRRLGIGIGIIPTRDDPLFNLEKIKSSVPKTAYDVMHPVKGDHNVLTAHADIYTRFALETLYELRQRRYLASESLK